MFVLATGVGRSRFVINLASYWYLSHLTCKTIIKNLFQKLVCHLNLTQNVTRLIMCAQNSAPFNIRDLKSVLFKYLAVLLAQSPHVI